MLHSAQVHRALARKRALAGDVDNQVQENELARRMLLRLTILHSKPQISPLPQLARLALAQVESDLGRADVAGQVYRELISQYADTPYSLYALAMLDLAAGQSTSAVARLRKLETQELDPILARRARAQLLALESAQ